MVLNRRDVLKYVGAALLLPTIPNDTAKIVQLATPTDLKLEVQTDLSVIDEAELYTRWATCQECQRIEKLLAIRGRHKEIENGP